MRNCRQNECKTLRIIIKNNILMSIIFIYSQMSPIMNVCSRSIKTWEDRLTVGSESLVCFKLCNSGNSPVPTFCLTGLTFCLVECKNVNIMNTLVFFTFMFFHSQNFRCCLQSVFCHKYVEQSAALMPDVDLCLDLNRPKNASHWTHSFKNFIVLPFSSIH